MAKAAQASVEKSEKKSQPVAELDQLAVPAGQTTLYDDVSSGPPSAGDGSDVSQASRLGNRHIQAAQRQALARQIGRTQGNQHLQRVIVSLNKDGSAPALKSSEYHHPALISRSTRKPTDGRADDGEISDDNLSELFEYPGSSDSPAFTGTEPPPNRRNNRILTDQPVLQHQTDDEKESVATTIPASSSPVAILEGPTAAPDMLPDQTGAPGAGLIAPVVAPPATQNGMDLASPNPPALTAPPETTAGIDGRAAAQPGNPVLAADGGGAAPAINDATADPQSDTTSLQRPPIQPDTMPGEATEAASESYRLFSQQAAAQRDSLIQSTEDKKQQIRAAAETDKQNAQASIEAEAVRVEGVYDQTIQQVQQAVDNARTQIESQRDAKVEATRQAAETELANLGQVIEQKQAAARQAGEDKANAATRFGDEQSQRANLACRQKSSLAGNLGERKVQQYANYNRAGRIASAIREMVNEAARNFLSAGNQVAETARKDASDLAEKFRKEAGDVAEKFSESQTSAVNKIEQERDQTIQGLTQLAQEPITQLESNGRQTIEQLQAQRTVVGPQIRQSAVGAAAAIDRAAGTACDRLDQETTQAVQELDAFMVQMEGRFSAARGAQADQQLREAQDQLASSRTEFDASMEQLVNESLSTLENGANQAVQEVSSQADQLAEPVVKVGTDFETNADKAANDTTAKMEESTSKSVDSMHTAVTDVERELQETINQSERQWATELADGTREIQEKVDKSLAEQEKISSELPQKLDDKAEEIENESFLSRALSWVGGIIVGVFEAAWDMLKGLAIAILIIIAIIVVIALVILVFFGLDALLAVIAAVAAFIVAAAEVIAVILEVAAVIMVLVGLAIGAYYLYLAITRDDLSDYERGKLAGRGVFEIVFAIFGGKIFSKLGKWFGRLAGAEEAGADAARLARLRTLVSDEAQLQRLLAAVGGDAAKLEQLIARAGDANRLDRLINLAGDASKVENLLAHVGDGAQLERLLGKVTDAGQLERLLGKTTDAAQLEQLLGKVADAGQLERLLGKTTDAAQLEKLLGKVPDAAQLERLLGRTTDAAQLDRLLGKTTDAAQLERLLGHTPDAAQLERLLAKTTNAEELERLLGLAGNDATRLEGMFRTVPNSAELERFLRAGNPIWEGQLGPAPANAVAAAEHAAANGGAAQPGFAGNRPYQNNGRNPGDMILPRQDPAGNPITYREYDTNPLRPGVNRGTERIVIGDGNRYYTNTHYRGFTKF